MKNEEVIIFIAKPTAINEVSYLMMQTMRELSLPLRGLYAKAAGPTLSWLRARPGAWSPVCSTPTGSPGGETDMRPFYRLRN